MQELGVTLVLAPPSFQLWFEPSDNTFSFALAALKHRCPWMRWDKEARVWQSKVCYFAPTLRFCRSMFSEDQITILWTQSNTRDEARQLRMF